MLIYNTTIVNEGRCFLGSVLIQGEQITEIMEGEMQPEDVAKYSDAVDATGLWLLPGVIDEHVHFREPGLTHKADIYTESRAAVAGGITSYMEMPNTKPPTTTIDLLEEKYSLGAQKSIANYSFYMGVTNDNINEIKKVNAAQVCGIKLFMGSSTGNMLVNNSTTISRIFAETSMLIATHNEDESTIQKNLAYYKNKYGDRIPTECHALIRSAEACYKSSAQAVELAQKYGTRLHVLHISTQKELSLFDSRPLYEKKITSEVCIHHLWFSNRNYSEYGNRIKWNPAIKTEADRIALLEGVSKNQIDVIATDHSPHLLQEKQGSYLEAFSGGPLIQHSLVAMLELVQKKYFTLEKVVEKMCHAPADLFHIDRRGYIRQGYYADLVLVKPNEDWTVSTENIRSKCGWSPFEGHQFHHKIIRTFVNGKTVFLNDRIIEGSNGKRLTFRR